MPLILTDLNSPIVEDRQSSFIGGQFSNAVPLQIDETSCVLLENAEEGVTGQAASRRGTVQLGNNVAGSGTISVVDYYKTIASDYPIAATTNSIPYQFSGGNWTQLVSGTPPTAAISTAVGNTFLYAVTGSGSIYKWNGTTWSTLSTDSPPSNCSILLWDGFRIIASGQSTAPDAIYFSGILNDALWASLSGGFQIQIGSDSRAITSVKAWTGSNLAVFKQNSTWLIGADPQLDVANMPVQRIHARIGCVARNSACQCGSDILFLANDYTVRSLQQTLASDDQWQLGQPLSFPIQDVLNRINRGVASKAAGIFWNNRYLLALPLDSSTTNNYIVVFNTITQKWSGGWTNLPVSYFAVRNDAGTEKLIMGLANDNKVIEFLDYVAEADTTDATYTDYNGTTVPYHFITRAMIFGDLDSKKKGLNMNMKLFRSKGRLTVTAIFDEGVSTTVKTINTGTPTPLTFPIVFPGEFPRLGVQPASFTLLGSPRFHQIQFEVQSASPGKKEVRALTVQAFPEATDLRGKFVAQTE